MDKTILVIGTYDTKDEELHYMCDRIRAQGGKVLSMDVSVLGDPSQPTDISKHDVTAAVGKTTPQRRRRVATRRGHKSYTRGQRWHAVDIAAKYGDSHSRSEHAGVKGYAVAEGSGRPMRVHM